MSGQRASHGIDRQRGASDPAASVWVSASAGTGKTHVLTTRILRLLLAGTPPARLLCLTFTKAAAAEMANRLQRGLAEWVGLGDGALNAKLGELIGRAPSGAERRRARQLLAAVLETPGGLKIQTIHAFCEALLRRFAVEAQVPPQFQVIDERRARELIAEARDRVLGAREAQAEGDLERIARLTNPDSLSDLLGSLLGARERFGAWRDAHGGLDAALDATRAQLGARHERIEDVHAEIVAEAGFGDADRRALAETLSMATRKFADRGKELAAWLGLPAEMRIRSRSTYCDVFLKRDGEPRESDLLPKKIAERNEALLDAMQREAERLADLREAEKALQTAQATAALLRLFDALLQVYQRRKRALGVLDFDDLIQATRDLLHRPGTAPWVLYKLDGGIDHILIDEAQDTNPEQWQIVRALADEFFAGAGARENGRTIFAVGDAKQSIFGFQRADPAAFESMQDHFEAQIAAAGADWRPLELAQSFRSTPAVLTAVDKIFEDPAARDGLSLRDRPVRHLPHRRGQAGRVELWPLETPDEDVVARDPWTVPRAQHDEQKPEERLAARIAGQIGDWLASGEVLESRGRPIRAGDVMILVQRREPFASLMIAALKRADVPVAGADRLAVGDALAVRDLLSLARVLLQPGDDLSLAEVLKSPLFDHDDDDLFVLAYERRGSLWRALAEAAESDQRFAATWRRLRDWRGLSRRLSPFAFFAHVLGLAGGRRSLAWRLGEPVHDPLDEFLGQALRFEAEHAPSLQGFVAWFDADSDDVQRRQDGERDEVRLLTVHGAKGLQAPIVFLPDTVHVPQQRASLFWNAADEGPANLFWRPYADLEVAPVRAAREGLTLREMAEYRRLLYVALTRAEDRLYIAGWHGRQKPREGNWYQHCAKALQKIGAAVDGDARGPIWRLDSPQTEPPRPETAAVAPDELPVPAWLGDVAPPEPRPARPLLPSRPAGALAPGPAPLRDDGAGPARRGTLIHRLLQTLPDLSFEVRESVAMRLLRAQAPDLDDDRRRALVESTIRTLNEAEFAALFAPGSLAEVAVVGRIGDDVVSGQIDRLAVKEDAALIADYKTGTPPGENSRDMPRTYLRQMAVYRALVAEIYPDRAVRCALVWVDGPLLVALDDADLRAALTA